MTAAEPRTKICAACTVRGVGLVFVREEPADVVRMASDPGESRYVALHDLFSGDELWLRASEICVVRAGDVTRVPDARAERLS